jgi:DNA-binding MarR family transcriptional regulator
MNKRRGAAAQDVMWSLLQAAGAVESRIEGALAGVGLSGAKLAALTQLVEAGEPVSLGELAAQCACVRSNITQLVDRLESEKLVRRVADANDRRSLRAAITPLGRERQAAGAKKIEAVRKQIAGALKAIDGGALARALADLEPVSKK